MIKTLVKFAVDTQEILNLFDQEFSAFDLSHKDEIKKFKEHQINYHWWEFYEEGLDEMINEIIIDPLNSLSTKDKENASSKTNTNLSPAKNLLNLKTDIQEDANELKASLSEKEEYEIAAITLILGMIVKKNKEAISLYGSCYSIHELLADAQNNNNEDALLMAINIDSACVNTQTAQEFISQSKKFDDYENFLINVGKAVQKEYKSPNVSYNTKRYREFSFYEALLRNYANDLGKKATMQEIAEISINHLLLFSPDENDESIIKKTSQLRNKNKMSRK